MKTSTDCGFAENTSTQTRLFSMDRPLCADWKFCRGKAAENEFMTTHSCHAAKAAPPGRALTECKFIFFNFIHFLRSALRYLHTYANVINCKVY